MNTAINIFFFLNYKICKMNIKEKLGLKIKDLRLKKGWSQEKLALESNLDRTYLPSIEKGERNVSIEVVEKLAIALGVKIKELFNE